MIELEFEHLNKSQVYRSLKELPKPKALDHILASKIYKIGNGKHGHPGRF